MSAIVFVTEKTKQQFFDRALGVEHVIHRIWEELRRSMGGGATDRRHYLGGARETQKVGDFHRDVLEN